MQIKHNHVPTGCNEHISTPRTKNRILEKNERKSEERKAEKGKETSGKKDRRTREKQTESVGPMDGRER